MQRTSQEVEFEYRYWILKDLMQDEIMDFYNLEADRQGEFQDRAILVRDTLRGILERRIR